MKYRLCIVILLTLTWVVLSEALTWLTVVLGLLVSVACVLACSKFLPFEAVSGIKLWRLLLYPLYLIVQIYRSGFYVIKLILTGAETEITEAKTSIDNEFLRVLLGNSVTMTPGSILLDLQDDKMTILSLCRRHEQGNGDDVIKGLQSKLLSIQEK